MCSNSVIPASACIAAIYARVSTKKQVTEGNGLQLQIRTCHEHCAANGFEVVEIFTDDSTGGNDDRDGLRRLKAWLSRNKRKSRVVVFDALSRVGRDVRVYREIKDFVIECGAQFSCPTFRFENTPENELFENITISFDQYHLQSNADQVKRRQRSRLLDGYWCYRAPFGCQSDGQGKPIRPHPRLAPIVKTALEGYACGRFQTQNEVRRFIEAQPEFKAGRKYKNMGNSVVQGVLTNVLYTGHLEYKPHGVDLRKAKHEPLISMATFQTIQRRLAEKPNAPRRQDASADFSLRGFVVCNDCGRPLTAGWSKGRRRRYPYYSCFKAGCPSKGKSIPRDRLETEFSQLLGRLQPSEEVAAACRAMLRDI